MPCTVVDPRGGRAYAPSPADHSGRRRIVHSFLIKLPYCSGGSRIFMAGVNSQSGCANLFFWPKTVWKGAKDALPLGPPLYWLSFYYLENFFHWDVEHNFTWGGSQQIKHRKPRENSQNWNFKNFYVFFSQLCSIWLNVRKLRMGIGKRCHFYDYCR